MTWFHSVVSLAAVGAALVSAPARAQIVVSYLYVIQGGQMYEVDEQSGHYRAIGPSTDWTGTTSFTSDSGSTGYAVQDDALWQIALGARSFTKLSDGWAGPTELTYGLTRHNGSWHKHLFAVQGDDLWRVEVPAGTTTSINHDGWAGATSMAILDWDGGDNELFVIDDDSLWRVNVVTGAYTLLGHVGDWAGDTSMTAFAGHLYIVESNRLWQVEPSNGAYTLLSSGWNSTTTMTDLDTLYAINGGNLYSASIYTGARTLIGAAGDWAGSTLMVSRYESH
jgi:hypothetical protein